MPEFYVDQKVRIKKRNELASYESNGVNYTDAMDTKIVGPDPKKIFTIKEVSNDSGRATLQEVGFYWSTEWLIPVYPKGKFEKSLDIKIPISSGSRVKLIHSDISDVCGVHCTEKMHEFIKQNPIARIIRGNRTAHGVCYELETLEGISMDCLWHESWLTKLVTKYVISDDQPTTLLENDIVGPSDQCPTKLLKELTDLFGKSEKLLKVVMFDSDDNTSVLKTLDGNNIDFHTWWKREWLVKMTEQI